MVDSSRTIMTDAGFALETRVRADETKMQFTRAAISTDDHFSDTDDALAKLTELSNIQQDGKVTAVQVINTTTVYVQVDVNQAESKADYQMRSAALYAKDDDGTEVLYGVTVLQDPVFVHKDADGSYLGFGINTTVGRASNVVVVVDPANMVTQQVFEGTMKNYYTKAEVDAKFVTDDDFASKLPKNIATTDAANTFAKSQTLAGGATDGKGNAYATTKDVATGLNNGLSTKVTDNKNGTEQLNGVQVQPFNKLSDTIGGRNLLINTAQLNDSTVCLDTKSNISDTYLGLNIYQTANQWGGVRIYWSYLAPKLKTNTNYVMSEYVRNTSPTTSANIGLFENNSGAASGIVYNSPLSGNIGSIAKLPPNSGWTRISAPVNIASFPTNIVGWLRFENTINLTDGYVQFAGLKFEQGSIATDWTPAPEDKVNVSDMRKPASDVAGIEEVNAKQDKIGYTPADDSKVVHNTGNEEIAGTKTFDTAPIDKTTGNPYITKSGVPKVDLSNYATQQQLATKADTSAIDPSVIVKTTLTATDDVLNLADGTYRVWQVVPKNLPAIGDGSGSDWGYVTVKSISAGTRWVEYTNIFRRRKINVYSGSPASWSGWYMPNQDSLAIGAGANKITANGNTFVPLAVNVATGEICLPDGTAITLSLPGGVKLGDHMLNISATDGLTIDNQAYFTAVADETTAASKAAADPLHNYTTEE